MVILSVYDAMVRMAQEWSMRYTLVDGQGNFGNQDGDGPAAMRYTEARLERLAEHMLDDIEKDTVDFQPNFDDSEREPTVFANTDSPIAYQWLQRYCRGYGHEYDAS